MTHFIILMASLFVFIIGIRLLAKIEARSQYLLAYPEIKVIRNGVKWLRDHSQKKIFFSFSLILYFFTVFLKGSYLINGYSNYKDPFQLGVLIICIFAIPAGIYPYLYSLFYSREYNRLANVNYEDRVTDTQPLKSKISIYPSIKIGPLLFSFALLILEIFITF